MAIMIKKREKIKSFLNEIDGIVETSKRITIFTANNANILHKFPAFIRPGRIDKEIKLDYCTCSQIIDIYNHFTDTNEKLQLKELNIDISPAQIIKYILTNPLIKPDKIKKDLNIIGNLEITDNTTHLVKVKKDVYYYNKVRIKNIKNKIKQYKKYLENGPSVIKKEILKLEKETGILERKKILNRKKRKNINKIKSLKTTVN